MKQRAGRPALGNVHVCDSLIRNEDKEAMPGQGRLAPGRNTEHANKCVSHERVMVMVGISSAPKIGLATTTNVRRLGVDNECWRRERVMSAMFRKHDFRAFQYSVLYVVLL